MFKIGDFAVKPGYGVCKVVSIDYHKSTGSDSKQLYYTLKPEEKDSDILYVPINAEQSGAIRAPLNREEAISLISSIPKRKFVKTNDRTRIRRYKAALGSGSPETLLSLLMEIYQTDISTRKNTKGKNATDYVFQTAEKMLSSEIALALGCKIEDLPEVIRQTITANKQKEVIL